MSGLNRLKTQFCQVLVLALFGTAVPLYAELHSCKNLRDINGGGGQSKDPLPNVNGSFAIQDSLFYKTIQHRMKCLVSILSYLNGSY